MTRNHENERTDARSSLCDLGWGCTQAKQKIECGWKGTHRACRSPTFLSGFVFGIFVVDFGGGRFRLRGFGCMVHGLGLEVWGSGSGFGASHGGRV